MTRNLLSILALLLALGMIGYLYYRLTTAEEALALAEKRFTDCEQVTFQLQMQVASGKAKVALPAAKPPRQ